MILNLPPAPPTLSGGECDTSFAFDAAELLPPVPPDLDGTVNDVEGIRPLAMGEEDEGGEEMTVASILDLGMTEDSTQLRAEAAVALVNLAARSNMGGLKTLCAGGTDQHQNVAVLERYLTSDDLGRPTVPPPRPSFGGYKIHYERRSHHHNRYFPSFEKLALDEGVFWGPRRSGETFFPAVYTSKESSAAIFLCALNLQEGRHEKIEMLFGGGRELEVK